MTVRFLKQIGEGSSGKVFLAQDANQQYLAVKKIFNNQYGISHLIEPLMMAALKHPRINSAKLIHIKPEKIYIIQDHALGDLASFSKTSQSIRTDSLVQQWIYQIVDGVRFLHANQIIHADLKASNILLYQDLSIKITDFSSSIILTDSTLKSHRTGTINHCAPEILDNKGWLFEIDIWALAVTLYQIIFCQFLFPNPKCLKGKHHRKRRQLERMKMFSHLEEWFLLNQDQIAFSQQSSITDFGQKQNSFTNNVTTTLNSTVNDQQEGNNGQERNNSRLEKEDFLAKKDPIEKVERESFEEETSQGHLRSRSKSPSSGSYSEGTDNDEPIITITRPNRYQLREETQPQWDFYRNLIFAMLRFSPAERPSIEQVYQQLTSYLIETMPEFSSELEEKGSFQRPQPMLMRKDRYEAVIGEFRRLFPNLADNQFIISAILNIYNQPIISSIPDNYRFLTSIWVVIKIVITSFFPENPEYNRHSLLEKLTKLIPVHLLIQYEREICTAMKFQLI